MTVRDFQISAKVAAKAIAQPGLPVGARIAAAIAATLDAVKCNTNLGIVLLGAPLVHAALSLDPGRGATEKGFRATLKQALKGLTVEDAELSFAAIRDAHPAGLGASKRHDVNKPAKVTLLAAMAEAEGRDRIAWQYAHSFEDIFDIGIPALRAAQKRFEKHPKGATWAITAVYLAFLGRFPDSHILRKHGPEAAERVRREANEIAQAFAETADPEHMAWVLTAYDSDLKSRGINPGTSADLTVASLLAVRLLDIVAARTAGRTGGLAP